MKFIPQPKTLKKAQKTDIDGFSFSFCENIDERVVKATEKVPKGSRNVKIEVVSNGGEGYSIDFTKDVVEVKANGQAGAFYAVQTLRQIAKNGYCDAEYIEDEPDFKARGFYYDITRGRVPKLETLKELVDNMAYYKQNMLQLYVEHCFEFKEYDGIYQKYGYMTAEETKELDKYCKENFIELVPSLSCFGHLYELMQSDKYRHLCEYENYEPQSVRWRERMAHHTIDPTDPESIEVIKSLIDQYMPLFTSNKFNICCDETFDLGKGKNQGKDKDLIYLDFVNKIAEYIISKGKTPMMWGDIISSRPDLIDSIDSKMIFESWRYDADPDPDMIIKFSEAKRCQYVCPGVNNWSNLIELPRISVPNITKMADYGKQYGAEGFLNTCWGDYGQISHIQACMYGAIFGFAKSWNTNTDTDSFNKAIDLIYYGHEGASELMLKLTNSLLHCYWYDVVADYSNEKYGNNLMWTGNIEPEELDNAFNICEEVVPYLMSQTWENERARKVLINVCLGSEIFVAMLMAKKTGEKFGVNFKDAQEWLKDYSEIYLEDSKESELKEFISIVYDRAEKYLK